MSRDLSQDDDRYFGERPPQSDPGSRMTLSQGRGGGSGDGEDQRRREEELLTRLRSIIDESAEDRPSVSIFLDRLEERGVRPIASVQASGRWNGIVYEYSGHRIKGSHLGRAYTAKGLQQRRGLRYEPVRDDARLAQTLSPDQRRVRPEHESREAHADVRNDQRGPRSRDRSGTSPAERAMLWDVGRFRTVGVPDIAEVRYEGKIRPLREDLQHLAELGYVQRRIVPVDGRGRSLEVVALTRRGRNYVERNHIGDDVGQAIYSGFVKPREIVHDAALYRMYQAEVARIERDGGHVRHVVLDYELKKRAYSPLAKSYDLPPLEYAERQREIAEENGLRVIDGHIVLPDLRLEYETREREERHIDLELATRNYRAAHLKSKADAGFHVYADAGSNALASALDNHDIIAELLRM